MPPIKEFHHFDGVLRPDGWNSKRHLRKLLRHISRWDTALDDPRRDVLLARTYEYAEGGRTDSDCLRLFEPFTCGISGDVTPAYSRLSPDEVAVVRDLLPDAKVLLLVRDPIARAWSAYKMELRIALRPKRNRMSAEALRAAMLRQATPRSLRKFLRSAGARERSFPTRIASAWSLYGPALKIMDFAGILNDPDQFAADAGTFLLGSEVVSRSGLAAKNEKADRGSIPLGREMRAVLQEHFREEIAQAKVALAEIARGWGDG